ncbi:uncharacterized protein LOC135848253 isoform X8 [Planococcus citri]|uniref:uncharacterized protein LOC135848253 isoform X8 n=1 Tax=Planococcus citri TaxID=170843 RepID=UPI0031F8AB31
MSDERKMPQIPTNVFDILHPSPVSLKELSAMAVSLEIWRHEVDKYRRNCKLEEFDPSKLQISSKLVFPDLPSALYDAIDEYATRLGPSMDDWLEEHSSAGFHLHYGHQNYVLKDFDNFVCDYNGTIDYVKTAERMMRCHQFDVDKKFIVACTYCFEDDIRRFWPSVCEKIDLCAFEFGKIPLFYYWICCLKNELDKIPIDEYNESVDEVLLERCTSGNRRCIEYFWNRIPLERKMHKAGDLIYFHEDILTRFILPKLNDQQINELINMDTDEESLLETWLGNRHYDEEVILQLWMRFKHLVNPNTFKELIVRMLGNTAMSYRGTEDESKIDDDYIDMVNKKWTYLGSEIWNSAPDILKRSTIDDILFQSGLFIGQYALYVTKNVGILLAILPYATFEDRNEFWDYAWPELIDRTRGENLQRLMELCFKTQDEISQFKQNVLAKSANVKKLCVEHLRCNAFEYANDLVDFCCPEIQTARSLKQELLRSAFLSAQDSRLSLSIFSNIERFNTFINNAFESVEQASDFKNQLILSPLFQPELLKMLPSHTKDLMKFVDAFVSKKETVDEVKSDILELVKKYYRKRKYDDYVEHLMYQDEFLLWCLGSEEEVSDFERRYIDITSDNSDDYFDDYYGPFIDVYDDCI